MKLTLCIVGAGYVGLPLAVAFSKHFSTIVYTHSQSHANELKEGIDRTENFTVEELKASGLTITSNIEETRMATIYIITVPTPVDETLQPDLTPIINATSTVASVLKKGDIVVYESTVFIGCTEELCVPILEKESGLIYNSEFFCGYSPERINPSDTEHTIHTVVKIVSGSTPKTQEKLVSLYGSIVKAGIHEAPSIKVAEASKLLENIQRDVNIALMNELSTLYAKLNISTNDVINAASTKWNFNTYRPGFVGGHCISVDPYYLLLNASKQNISMPIIEQARRTNEYLPHRIIDDMQNFMASQNMTLKGSSILLLGIAFKENCNDIRNSKSAALYNLLLSHEALVEIVDPYVDPIEVKRTYNIDVLHDLPKDKRYDAIIVSVAHDKFKNIEWDALRKENTLLYDMKNIISKENKKLNL